MNLSLTKEEIKMKNIDNMMTFLDAWFLSERGEDPSKAIENQERRGQADMTRAQRLPRKVNSNSLPSEIFFAGVSNDMDYETRSQITNANVEAYTRVQYEKMGIEIISEHDELFWNVKLPKGWEIKPTDHSMWNELLDNKGRKRMTFFYKAAFYDRDAFSNLQTRYQLDVTHIADSADYDIWKKSDIQGMVKDGDTIIYQTKRVPAVEDYVEEDKIKNGLWEELKTFMNEHHPDYKNVHAYWD
jgi:hypothetical protein